MVPTTSEAATALGASVGGRIEVRDDLSPAETLTTFRHEAARELLHRNTAVGRLKHAIRELEADSVCLCRR